MAQARGNLEIDRKHYPEAVEAFQLVLTTARNRNLPAIQAAAFSSLGNVAMLREHFDEALQWYGAALQKSQEIGMQSSIATVLGNMGWNYSMIGDYENAEALYKQALEKSGQCGIAKRPYLLAQYAWRSLLSAASLRRSAGNVGKSLCRLHTAVTIKRCSLLAWTVRPKLLLRPATLTSQPNTIPRHCRSKRPNPDPIGGRRSQLLAGRIAWSQCTVPASGIRLPGVDSRSQCGDRYKMGSSCASGGSLCFGTLPRQSHQ